MTKLIIFIIWFWIDISIFYYIYIYINCKGVGFGPSIQRMKGLMSKEPNTINL